MSMTGITVIWNFDSCGIFLSICFGEGWLICMAKALGSGYFFSLGHFFTSMYILKYSYT